MTFQVFADITASISELKANPMKVVANAGNMPIAVFNGSELAFYCVPAPTYEALMELIDDMELLRVVKMRLAEESVKVSIDGI